MKIVFFINKLNIGGPQKVVVFLANMLVKDGHDVCIISYSNKETDIVIDKNVKIIKLGYEAEYYNNLNYLFKRLAQIPLIFKIRRIIEDLNPDIICAFTISVLRIIQTALAFKKYHIVSSERGNPFIYSEKFYKIARKAYKNCWKVVFQTEKVKDFFDLNNSYVISNPAIFRNENVQYTRSGIDNLILAAGRLEAEKGFDFLLSCFKRVSSVVNCHLKIYGSGSMKDELLKYIQENHMESIVELCGEDNAFLSKNIDAAAFILPSYTEGMPNALIEAMIAGIPCVATNCTSGGPRFLLENGKAGYLVEVGNKKQMVEAIIHVLNNSVEAIEKAQLAQERLQLLAPEKIYAEWLDVFELNSHEN